MAGLARLVIPGLPHHITQRGNRRQRTFFSDEDYAAYVRRSAASTQLDLQPPDLKHGAGALHARTGGPGRIADACLPRPVPLNAAGSLGELHFDEPSGHLIVLQSQPLQTALERLLAELQN